MLFQKWDVVKVYGPVSGIEIGSEDSIADAFDTIFFCGDEIIVPRLMHAERCTGIVNRSKALTLACQQTPGSISKSIAKSQRLKQGIVLFE